MTPEQREELKPCPFDAGAAKIVKENLDERFGYVNLIKIQCSTCGVAVSAHGDTSKPGYADNSTTEARAIAAWNRRAQVEAPTVPQWQPIETAPRTGRTLLLGRFNSMGNWRTMRGQWFSAAAIAEEWEGPDEAEEGWYETAVEPDVPNCWSIAPTFWMPLHAAPTIPAIPGTKEDAT